MLVSLNRILRLQLQNRLSARFSVSAENRLRGTSSKDGAANGAASGGDSVYGSAVMGDQLLELLMDVLLALLESQERSSLVFERLCSTVELGLLHAVIMPHEVSDERGEEEMDGVNSTGYVKNLQTLFNEYSDLLDMDLTRAQAKYLAFTEILGDVNGNDTAAANARMDLGLACVEVIFNGKVEKIYFQIPVTYCLFMYYFDSDFFKIRFQESTRDVTINVKKKVLDQVADLSSHEVKLQKFVQYCKFVFRESLHQKVRLPRIEQYCSYSIMLRYRC